VILFNEVEFNENVDDLRNPAEIIIYTNILEKVKEIHGSKEEVIESIEEEYEKLKSKYELSDI
jgi:iron-sulfur cluster repair protein YtfE (RIC family)